MYIINEGTIKIPDTWKDESINVLSSENGSGISFTITRELLPWGMGFNDYVKKELSALADSLTEYQEINQSSGQIDKHETRYLEYTWLSKDGPIHQLLTIIYGENKVLVITVSAQSTLTKSQKSEIINIIHSFKFHDHQKP